MVVAWIVYKKYITNGNEAIDTANIDKLVELKNKYNLVITKGSDTHKDYIYDSDFFVINKEGLLEIINM